MQPRTLSFTASTDAEEAANYKGHLFSFIPPNPIKSVFRLFKCICNSTCSIMVLQPADDKSLFIFSVLFYSRHDFQFVVTLSESGSSLQVD